MPSRRSLLTTVATATTALAGTVLGGSALTGCSSQPPVTSGPVPLRMTIWTANKNHIALFDEIAASYVAANPARVSSVSFDTLPFESYTTTLTTQIAGGNPPDLAWIFESSAPAFVASGALADLKPALQQKQDYAYDDLDPSTLSLWSTGDGLFAYPFSNSPFVVFVNTDRLKKAGLRQPRDLVAGGGWTFDALRDLAAASVATSGGGGLVIGDFNFSLWEVLATIWGGWNAMPWSADGRTATFSAHEMTAAMRWIHHAIFTAKAIPTPGTTTDFFAGQATFAITQISRAATLDKSFAWDVVPLPAGPARQRNVVGQAGIGVLRKGRHPEVAADFLAHFTSAVNGTKLARYFPPPRRSLLNTDTLAAANPLLSKEQLTVVVNGIADPATKPAHPNFAQLQTTVKSKLDPMWTADADIPVVLASVDAAVTPLLTK